MIKVVICDDEKIILQQLQNYVSAVLGEQKVEYELLTFSHPMKLLQMLKNDKADILLLDIDMPGINGMDIASELRKQEHQPLLIFVTCHESFVYESFQYQPFDFIRKSCYEKDLKNSLLRALNQLKNRKQEYLIEQGDMIIRLQLSDILYFEACANYITIVTKETSYQQRKPMHQLQEELQRAGFIRIHKGYLVNQKAIYILKSDKVILINNIELPIGRHYNANAKAEIMKYLRG